MDENSSDPIWWYKPLEGAESFMFGNLPLVHFTLRFDPDETNYPGYLTTYLGDTPYMEEAEVLLLNQDTYGLLINLIKEPLPVPGTIVVSGSLVEEGGKKTGLKIKMGKYEGDGTGVQDVPVYLRDLSGEIKYADRTGSEGDFEFNGISTGDYLFKFDYMGISMGDQSDTLKASTENEEFEVAAIISNGEINCDITKLSTGTNQWEEMNLRLYPNPFSEAFNLELASTKNQNLDIYLFDLSGRCVALKKEKLAAGMSYNFHLNMEAIEKGMYILKLNLGEDEYQLKVLKE